MAQNGSSTGGRDLTILPQSVPITGSTFPRTQDARPSNRTISYLLVLSRYADDALWLTDPNTGVLDNSTGTPTFIMPIEIYQASDIGPDIHPIFPGLPTNVSLDSCNPLPMWPSWAWRWAWEKNRTRDKAAPGSSQEAEFLARERLGLPNQGHIPIGDEWRDIEERLNAWRKMVRPEHAGLVDAMISNTGSADRPDEQTARSESSTAEGVRNIRENRKREPDNTTLAGLFSAANHSAVIMLREVSPELPLRLVPNRGAEAMAYLTAIIDHYDELAAGNGPDIMVFAHAHRLAWHTILGQDWTMRRLVSSPPADPELPLLRGYMPLACLERWRNDISHLFPTELDANWQSNNGPRWHESLAGRYAQAWREHLGEAYGGMPLPDFVRVPTAATFAATRAAIIRRPKEFYVGMREWLMDTHIENKWLGIVMEFTWGITMSNSTFVNPSQEQCLCALYNVCTGYSEV